MYTSASKLFHSSLSLFFTAVANSITRAKGASILSPSSRIMFRRRLLDEVTMGSKQRQRNNATCKIRRSMLFVFYVHLYLLRVWKKKATATSLMMMMMMMMTRNLHCSLFLSSAYRSDASYVSWHLIDHSTFDGLALRFQTPSVRDHAFPCRHS